MQTSETLENYWPIISVNQQKHLVVVKGLKVMNGIQYLIVRDSARDPNHTQGEILVENKVTNYTNQMNLALPVCVYFTMS